MEGAGPEGEGGRLLSGQVAISSSAVPAVDVTWEPSETGLTPQAFMLGPTSQPDAESQRQRLTVTTETTCSQRRVRRKVTLLPAFIYQRKTRVFLVLGTK